MKPTNDIGSNVDHERTQRNQSSISIMDRINRVFEHQYSPSAKRLYNKSENSKSQMLLGNSRINNESTLIQPPAGTQLPTIPSKYQKIIKEAAYQSNAVSTLNRAYINAAAKARWRNRSVQERDDDDDSSTLSMYSSKHQAMSTYDQTSSTGLSHRVYSEKNYNEGANGARHSFVKCTSKLNKKHAFGSSIKRFDSNQDFKKVFNTEPGPGSYLNIEDVKRSLTLTNDTTVTTRNHNASGAHNYSTTGSNSYIDRQGSVPGFGSKDERFKTPHEIRISQEVPGPGTYEYRAPVNKKNGLINPKPTVSLNFNENNPLSYVRPITVNLYIKHDNPGVGKYDAEKPFGFTKRNVCKPAFVSKDKRLDKNFSSNPAPTDYTIPTRFDLMAKEKNHITSSFRSPVQRKIYPVNLYDPHAPVSPKVKMPGPGYYNTADKGTIKERTAAEAGHLGTVKLNAVFIEDNTDRFGNQIYPTTTVPEKPGPAEYYPNSLVNKKKPKGVAIGYAERNVFESKTHEEKQNIGPGSYNTNLEPKKISFFLNQGEKWIR